MRFDRRWYDAHLRWILYLCITGCCNEHILLISDECQPRGNDYYFCTLLLYWRKGFLMLHQITTAYLLRLYIMAHIYCTYFRERGIDKAAGPASPPCALHIAFIVHWWYWFIWYISARPRHAKFSLRGRQPFRLIYWWYKHELDAAKTWAISLAGYMPRSSLWELPPRRDRYRHFGHFSMYLISGRFYWAFRFIAEVMSDGGAWMLIRYAYISVSLPPRLASLRAARISADAVIALILASMRRADMGRQRRFIRDKMTPLCLYYCHRDWHTFRQQISISAFELF